MGASVAPSFANIFVHHLEQKIFLQGKFKGHILKYWRYVDDILIIWQGTEDTFKNLLIEANSYHPTIKFTGEWSNTSLNFLDVKLGICGNSIITEMYSKPTDRNTLLLSSSYHNPHTMNAIPKSQYLRARRIASTDTQYKSAANLLTKKFSQRGYYTPKLQAIETLVSKQDRQELLKRKEKNRSNQIQRIPFVSKFGRQSKKIEQIVRQYWPILQQDTTYGSLFKQPPLFSYTRGRSLRDCLCPSDVTQKQSNTMFWGPPKKGTYACLNCICCSSIIKGDTVNHPTKGNIIRLKDFCTCETKNVIYMLKCPCGLAYVGQTSRSVKERIKEHRGNIRNYKVGTQSDTPVSRHFTSHGHSLIQLKWLVLEQVKRPKRGGNLSKLLLQREALWIKKLNTMTPMGLNDYWSLSPFLY
ncbi:uncharacterized protein LOC121394192 [Xenopus laevis]|nr:uncharacterized protein LOC121394192 [Xenopus laevis]